MCVWLGGGKESVSNWHFLVVVAQPTGFCILKKQANYSAWFISLRLIHHFLADCCHLETEGWWKQGPWPPVERSIQKLIQQTFKYPCVEKSSLMVRHNMVMWCMLHWVHVSMYDVLDVCSITYQNMCIMLKIQKLHLKLSLKSSERLAAVVEVN